MHYVDGSMDPRKRSACIRPDWSIREAIETIDRAGLGVGAVVDAGSRLLGILTDGDIRRSVLKGVGLDESVATIMNTKPIVVRFQTDVQSIRQIVLGNNLEVVPVVDDDGRLVDIIVMADLLSLPLSNPDITDKEIRAVVEVLQTPNLSLGPRLVEFEDRVAAYVGTRYAVAVNSGTSGLHLCVKALDIRDGDEVITTPFSFIASSNSILFERATPVFVDIEPTTLNIDVARIEEKITAKTKAILPVHVFGQPCDMRALMAVARKHGLAVIEDACEAIGAKFEGRHVGTFGNCGVFAFYPNKQMTTGEGGVVVTDDDRLARLCRSYRNQGRGEGAEWLAHERLGYNYRLSEIHCALGIAQIERLDEILEKRRAVAQRYTERLRDVPGIRVPFVADNVQMSWFVYVVRLDIPGVGRRERDEVLYALRKEGIACNNYFPPIHLQPFYREAFGYREGDYPVTERVSKTTIALPFFNNLEHGGIDHVCAAVQRIIGRNQSAHGHA